MKVGINESIELEACLRVYVDYIILEQYYRSMVTIETT